MSTKHTNSSADPTPSVEESAIVREAIARDGLARCVAESRFCARTWERVGAGVRVKRGSLLAVVATAERLNAERARKLQPSFGSAA